MNACLALAVMAGFGALTALGAYQYVITAPIDYEPPSPSVSEGSISADWANNAWWYAFDAEKEEWRGATSAVDVLQRKFRSDPPQGLTIIVR